MVIQRKHKCGRRVQVGIKRRTEQLWLEIGQNAGMGQELKHYSTLSAGDKPSFMDAEGGDKS